FAAIMTVLAAAAAPLLALAYGNWRLLVPGLVISLLVPAIALQSPSWIFYRRMEYMKQRLITAVDPVVGFIATIVLAVLGAGYWSLIVGYMIGAYTAGIVAIFASPYTLRLDYDRGTFKEYWTFSWPLMLGSAVGILLGQLSLF